MSLTVSSTARASEPQILHNTVWGVRDPVLTRPRPHRTAGRSRDTCRPGTGRRCLGSTLARHGTSVFLQMKDPDATHPRLFSEDSTTSTEEKVKIIMKTRDVLLATRKGANCQRQDADASAARHLETTTPGSRTRSPPDTTHTEPLVDSGHQDTSASADQETPLDVPAQTVLPTPAPTTTQQQPSSTSPGTIAGKLYYMAGALVGALGIFSSLLI